MDLPPKYHIQEQTLQGAEELEPTDSISQHFIHLLLQRRIHIAIKAPDMRGPVLFLTMHIC